MKWEYKNIVKWTLISIRRWTAKSHWIESLEWNVNGCLDPTSSLYALRRHKQLLEFVHRIAKQQWTTCCAPRALWWRAGQENDEESNRMKWMTRVSSQRPTKKYKSFCSVQFHNERSFTFQWKYISNMYLASHFHRRAMRTRACVNSNRYRKNKTLYIFTQNTRIYLWIRRATKSLLLRQTMSVAYMVNASSIHFG